MLLVSQISGTLCKFHCSRLKTVEDIGDCRVGNFWDTVYTHVITIIVVITLCNLFITSKGTVLVFMHSVLSSVVFDSEFWHCLYSICNLYFIL